MSFLWVIVLSIQVSGAFWHGGVGCQARRMLRFKLFNRARDFRRSVMNLSLFSKHFNMYVHTQLITYERLALNDECAGVFGSMLKFA